MKSTPHKASIDLGLAVSRLHCTFGVPKTHHEIACYCGCSWQRIWQIEQKALRRIRKYLYRNKELRDELAGIFGA